MKSRHLSETDILGPRTRQIVVRADDSDTREWIQGQPVCRALGQHRIAHLGVRQAYAPYSIVRLKQGGAFFMACLGGEGRILVDGRWAACRAGMGCLLPPHMLHAFHAVEGKPWHFVWVRYQAEPGSRPIARAGSPVMTKFDGAALGAAATGLHAECLGSATPAAVHHWIELVQGYVLRFARPGRWIRGSRGSGSGWQTILNGHGRCGNWPPGLTSVASICAGCAPGNSVVHPCGRSLI